MTVADYMEAIVPELMNVTRLFRLPDSEWEADRFRWSVEEADGSYVCTCTADDHAVKRSVPVPVHEDARISELHRKRAARRLCKQTLYDLCREITGIHPPWGSLTGIRPTRLLYEALEQGLSIPEAKEHVRRCFDVTP